MSYIDVKNVSYTYNVGTDDEIKAVDNVSFSIEQGEFLAILGSNGSGKSTMARLLNGLLQPKSGIVLVDGVSTQDKKRKFEVRSKVGIVFQNPDNQMVASIIEDDVAFGPENLGFSREEIRARVDWALDIVSMSEYAKKTPFRLSGGQKQRVAIAGVLAMKPSVLVLDEATAMLDPPGRKEILAVAKKLQKEDNIAIVLITHYIDEALLADKVLVLDKGKQILYGDKREVLMQKEVLESCDLTAPFALDMAYRLKEKGLDLGDDILTHKELLERINDKDKRTFLYI